MLINDECKVSNESAQIMPKRNNSASSTKRRMSNAKLSHLSSISSHPFDLMYHLIEYFYAKNDIQTSALLSASLMRSNDNLIRLNASKEVPRQHEQLSSSVNKLAAFDRYIPLFVVKER